MQTSKPFLFQFYVKLCRCAITCETLVIHKKKHCHYKPGSVPLARRLPFIYSAGYPTALAFYPPSLPCGIRADNPRTMVYANLQPPDGTARRSPAVWWALTPPSHPYPCGRLFSSSGSNRHRLLALSPVERPTLPGLSSRALLDTSGRP